MKDAYCVESRENGFEQDVKNDLLLKITILIW